MKVIGLTLPAYSVSLCPSFNETPTNSPSLLMKPVQVQMLIPPLLVPAGANHGKET